MNVRTRRWTYHFEDSGGTPLIFLRSPTGLYMISACIFYQLMHRFAKIVEATDPPFLLDSYAPVDESKYAELSVGSEIIEVL